MHILVNLLIILFVSEPLKNYQLMIYQIGNIANKFRIFRTELQHVNSLSKNSDEDVNNIFKINFFDEY